MNTSVSRVLINNVEVGSIPTDQFQAIVAETKRDWRLYAASIWSTLFAGTKLFLKSLAIAPVVALTIASLLVFFYPDGGTAFFDELKQTTGAEISNLVRSSLTVSWLATVIALVFGIAFGAIKFGYTDPFSRVIGERIRFLLEEPNDGPITVITPAPRKDGSAQRPFSWARLAVVGLCTLAMIYAAYRLPLSYSPDPERQQEIRNLLEGPVTGDGSENQ